jgi:hypothetical protein
VLLALGASQTAKGALTLDITAGAHLRLRVYDNTPALVNALDCGVISNAGHKLKASWNAAAGLLTVTDNGVTIGSYAGAAWTPSATATTPCYCGSDAAGANGARMIAARPVVLWNK